MQIDGFKCGLLQWSITFIIKTLLVVVLKREYAKKIII